MLQALMEHDMEQRRESDSAFARRTGLSRTTVSAVLTGRTNPARNATTRQKLAEGLGLDGEDDVRALSGLSVGKACDILLRDRNLPDPQEEELASRFYRLMYERGSSIQASAFIIYLTGDQEHRESMIATLEEQPLLGPETSPQG